MHGGWGVFYSTGRTRYNAAHLTGGGGTINEWLWREVEGAEREIKRVYIAENTRQGEIIKALNLKFSDQKRVNFGITSERLCECTVVKGRLRSGTGE